MEKQSTGQHLKEVKGRTDGEAPRLPEWAPKEGGKGFACRVMDGVEGGHDGIASYEGTGKKAPMKKTDGPSSRRNNTPRVCWPETGS